MSLLGGAIVEAVVMGTAGGCCVGSATRWFQSLGCVLGMDWHSSGITIGHECPEEIGEPAVVGTRCLYLRRPRQVVRQTPLNCWTSPNVPVWTGGRWYVQQRSTKVDNTAVQDGFQLYLHSFVVTAKGWAVIQQE